MCYGPESLKSEGILAVKIIENDRQHTLTFIGGIQMCKDIFTVTKKTEGTRRGTDVN